MITMLSDAESLGLLGEIEALVSDKLQVVSYKWLSRNFLVSSNVAKRLLQQFVEKQESGLEVVFSLSGWLKNDPSIYHIRLVSGRNLAEAREEFDGSCSFQVYSVQSCIPRDPAALWNAEFVQAEELFKQPPGVDNCLRDNRFCGISSSFVKRNVEGTPVSIVVPHTKIAGVPGPSRSNYAHQTPSVPQPQQIKGQQKSPKNDSHIPNIIRDVKSVSSSTGVHDQASKPVTDKERALPLPANKRKGQNDKSSSGTGGSLTNLWGRTSAKSEPSGVSTETNISVPNPTATAEAQICAREAVEDGSSEDEGQDFNFKRASNGENSRKRKVVFDFSDEEGEYEDAINLASPDLPKGKSCLKLKQITSALVPEKSSLNFDEQIEDKPKFEEEKATDRSSNQSLTEDSSVVNKVKDTELSSSEKIQRHSLANDLNKKDDMADAAPNSHKRKKVLKTRIDERGREVTEVVWEGEETETRKDNKTARKAENNAATSSINRPPVTKKSPAVGSTASSNPVGKAGNKKTGNSKDPKQGNILSFFKKV